MERLPTDREILRTTLEEYRKDYPSKGKVHVPIDVPHIARKLGIGEDMLFGRLYYDMGTRLKHRDPADPNRVLASVFEPRADEARNVVNFPFLAGKLAELEDQHTQQRLSLRPSIFAIVFAALAAFGQLLSTLPALVK